MYNAVCDAIIGGWRTQAKRADIHRSCHFFRLMSRLSSELSGMPMANLLIVSLCCLTFVYQVLDDALDGPKLSCYTLCPLNIIFLREYYRVVSCGFFHGSLMHVGMNMLTAAAIGSFLEKNYGTLRHLVTVLWGVLLVPSAYVVVAWMCYRLVGVEGPMFQHSVGFSGVLFQLSVLEANMNPHSERSVFGMFRVSSSAYPWAMLLVMQFILPHVSFLGHLSGILVGTLQLFGVFDFIFPSDACLRAIEDWACIRPLTSKPNYVRVPGEDNNAQRRTPLMLVLSMNRLATSCFLQCGNLLETLKFCIFGANVTHRALEAENLPLSNLDSESRSLTDSQHNQDIDDIELQMARAESLSKR